MLGKRGASTKRGRARRVVRTIGIRPRIFECGLALSCEVLFCGREYSSMGCIGTETRASLDRSPDHPFGLFRRRSHVGIRLTARQVKR